MSHRLRGIGSATPIRLDKIENFYPAVRSGDVAKGRGSRLHRKAQTCLPPLSPAGILCTAAEFGRLFWLRFLPRNNSPILSLAARERTLRMVDDSAKEQFDSPQDEVISVPDIITDLVVDTAIPGL